MTTLQIDLLRALRAAGQFGLYAEDLLADMRQGRHGDLTLPQLERALRDLADESFVEPFTTVLKQKRWKIAQHGINALTEAKL